MPRTTLASIVALLLFVSACATDAPPESSPFCETVPDVALRNATWWNRSFDPAPSPIDAPELVVHGVRPTGDGIVRVRAHGGTLGPYSDVELDVGFSYPRTAVGEVEASTPGVMMRVDGCTISTQAAVSVVVISQTGEELGPPDWVSDDFSQVAEVTVEISLDEAAGTSLDGSCVRDGELVHTFELHRSAVGYAALRESGCVQPLEE